VGAVKELALEIGQNRLLVLGEAVARVSVADPKVADLKIITPTQLLLTAHGPGSTDLTLWNRQDQPMVVALRVRRNLEGLRRQVSELFPGEKIKVSGEGDLIVLSGEVSDVRVPERVVEVAKLHSEKIVNLITVSGNQQVQLEVKFAEVSRNGLRAMGFNLFHIDQAGNRVGGFVAPPSSNLLEPLSIPGTGGAGPPPVFPPSKGNAFTLFFSSFPNFPFSVAVSLLESNGLAKVLAEPTLVALSGQEAKFLSGGEFPIPISTGFGNVAVQWKQFGIILEFVPTVLGQDTIQLRLVSEVSEVDPSRQVTIGGFTLPALATRKSETTIRLNDGQSFAIAGLLSNNVRSQIDKVPLLGDIPILGALFRSVEYRRSESELLVVVTSRLTRPLAPHEVPPLPTDAELNDPNDFALFLLGLEGRGAPDGQRARDSRSQGRGDPAQQPQSLLSPPPGRAAASRSRRGPAGELGFVR
jgi:pilus assembly protein CpaC